MTYKEEFYKPKRVMFKFFFTVLFLPQVGNSPRPLSPRPPSFLGIEPLAVTTQSPQAAAERPAKRAPKASPQPPPQTPPQPQQTQTPAQAQETREESAHNTVSDTVPDKLQKPASEDSTPPTPKRKQAALSAPSILPDKEEVEAVEEVEEEEDEEEIYIRHRTPSPPPPDEHRDRKLSGE